MCIISLFIYFFFLLYCSASLDDLSEADSKGWRVLRPWQRAGALRKVSDFLLLRCHLSVYGHSFSQDFLQLDRNKMFLELREIIRGVDKQVAGI